MRNIAKGIPKYNKNTKARRRQFVARSIKDMLAQKPVLRKKNRSRVVDEALGLSKEPPLT